jgi:hypothetical protein
MTGNGKIARLPRKIRDQLNRRLDDGESGVRLVEWLNALPEVQQVLKSEFGGRPISEQNLSEWKQRGFREWLRHQEACDRMRWMTERAADLDDTADGIEISDRLGSVLAVELADAAQKLDEIADPQERWHRLREILRELWRLRSEDHHGHRMQLQREQWERNVEREEEEDFKRGEKERKANLVSLFFAKQRQGLVAEMLGGGENGEKWADWLVRVQHNLSMPDWWRTDNRGPDSSSKAKSDSIQPDQTESNRIKPDEK